MVLDGKKENVTLYKQRRLSLTINNSLDAHWLLVVDLTQIVGTLSQDGHVVSLILVVVVSLLEILALGDEFCCIEGIHAGTVQVGRA